MIENKTKVHQLNDSSIREIVLERLEGFGASRYDLAHYGGVDGAASTVFRFLSGEASTSVGSVEQILNTCNIGLVFVGDNPPEWMQWEIQGDEEGSLQD